jgi:chorismate mutase / prephenate dehydratase
MWLASRSARRTEFRLESLLPHRSLAILTDFEAAMEQPKPNESLAEVDQAIAELLLLRTDLVKQLAAADVQVGDSLTTMLFAAPLSSKLPADVVKSLGRIIEGATRLAATERTSVTYLGPPLSYSYLATVQFFSEAAKLIPVTTIAAVFEDVIAGRTKFGVVPIENSTDGRVIDTLSCFADSPIEIVGEVSLPIHHCLLSHSKTENIQSVHSKPQALSQCRNWLAMHLPGVKLVECSSTAAAAELANDLRTVAAIASYEAGIHYGLPIVARDIEDNRFNVTRFAVIGKGDSKPTGNDKTSLMLQIPHRSGSLSDVMQTFQKLGINLTWIESFPIRNNPYEYLFFIELEGHRKTANVAQAIEQLASHTVRLECLGSYPRATQSASSSIE